MRILLVLLWMVIGVASKSADPPLQRLVVQSASTVTVRGKTNVNKFDCSISKYAAHDTLTFVSNQKNQAVFKRGIVALDATGFKCNNPIITKDFDKTIKSEEFPTIVIEFMSFEEVPNLEAPEEKFMGHLKVTMTGVTVPADLRCSMQRDAKGGVLLDGRHNFTFADFKMKPPRKILGAIKIDETITVDFHLVLKKI
jgi:hypothetical protein